MKFVIPTQEFNYLITKCLSVVSTKPAMPILSNLLIRARDNILSVTASDLTVSIQCQTEAKILEEGAVALPAKKLAPLVRELSAANLTISSNPQGLTEIIANGSRFKLHGMNHLEYPELPSMDGADEVRVQQSDLKEMLYRTAFAVSREDNRHVLTGVNMQIVNGEATFFGTDGKRMARGRIPIVSTNPALSSSTIPIKAIDEILRTPDEGETKIQILADKIAIEAGDTKIITKLIVGEYPDLTPVIPEHSTNIISLHRDELSSLLKQISLFTSENSVSVKFSFSNGELNLSANTMEVGEARVCMPVNYHGPQLDIAFNPNYFLDVLRHIKEETVTMGITDAYNPGVLTDLIDSSSALKSRSLFVLMPLRMGDS